MGKGTIIGGGTDGRYVVADNLARARIDAELAIIEVRINALADDIEAAEDAVEVAREELATHGEVVDGLVQAWATERRAQADAGETVSGDMSDELKAGVERLAELREKVAEAVLNLTRLQAEDVSLKTRRKVLQEIPADPQISAWCADLTEDLTGQVRTIEIPGEGTQHVLIAPGHADRAEYAEADGRLHARPGMSPVQCYLNAALLPGWQKFRPTHRVGAITSVDVEANTVSVLLDPATSSAQALQINRAERLSRVPVTYMTCNAAAFEVGDRCLVEFEGQDWESPRVIGFESNPKPCLLYVDCGWLDVTASGWPEQAGDGRFVLTATDSAAATWESVRDAMREQTGVRLDRVFADVFADGGKRGGQSFGIGIRYEGMSDSAAAARKDADATLLRMKMEARALMGATTGLLRCWAKGAMGRRLRETPSLTFDWDFMLGEIGGANFLAWSSGVLLGSTGFTLVRIEGANAICQRLALPDPCMPVLNALQTMTLSNRERAFVCTLLLAYATESGPSYNTPISGAEAFVPLLGWRWSWFSGQAVATGMQLLEDGGAICTTYRVTFSESGGEQAGAMDIVASDYLTTIASPWIWVPYPTTTELRAMVLEPDPYQPDARAPVHAFFTLSDDLIVQKVGGPEWAGTVTDLGQVQDDANYACGFGASSRTQRFEQIMEIRDTMLLEGAGYSYTTNYPTSYTTYEDVFTQTGPEEWPDKTAPNPPLSGWCSMQSVGTNLVPPGSFVGQFTSAALYGTHTWRRDTYVGSEADEAALILPWWYVDTAFVVEGDRDDGVTRYTQIVTTGASNGLHIYMPPSFPQWPIERYLYRVDEDPRFTGGGVPTSTSSTSTTNAPYGHYRATVKALVGTSGTGVETVLSDEGYPAPSLFGYFMPDPGGIPYYFLPYITHSLHGHAWGVIHGAYDSVTISGPAWIRGRAPIGGE